MKEYQMDLGKKIFYKSHSGNRVCEAIVLGVAYIVSRKEDGKPSYVRVENAYPCAEDVPIIGHVTREWGSEESEEVEPGLAKTICDAVKAYFGKKEEKK